MAAFDFDVVADFFSSDFKESCSYGGTTYDCIRMARQLERDVVAAGESNIANFELLTKAADFTPAIDGSIIFSSVTYQIKKATLDSTGKTYRLTLREQYG